MTEPRLTVLMSVHNGATYLAESIESILGQSFAGFEFLIIDDGSTDRSREIVEGYSDPRVRLVVQENMGLPRALNVGLELARGEYIARQDADDISLPERLERQVAYLDAHREVALIGSNYTIIDERGEQIATTRLFTHPDDLAVVQILSNQYGHGSVMMRRRVVMDIGGYDPSVGFVEDYDLWVRISRVAKIANIKDPLYLWRRSDSGLTLSNHELQEQQALEIRDREFRRLATHPRQFRIYSSWHPRSFRPSADQYFDRKAAVFRDLAYLFRREGHRWRAALLLAAAAVVVPRGRRHAFRLLLRHLKYRSADPVWNYEYVV